MGSTAVSFTLIWYNDGISSVIDCIQTLGNTKLSQNVRTQIDRRQKQVDRDRKAHHQSGTATRIIIANKRDTTKRLVQRFSTHGQQKSPKEEKKSRLLFVHQN